MIRLSFRMVAILAIALPSSRLLADEKEDPSRLTVERIFGGHEFEPESVSIRWLATGSGSMYTDAGARERPHWRPGPGPAITQETAKQRILVAAEHLSQPARSRRSASTAMPCRPISPDS